MAKPEYSSPIGCRAGPMGVELAMIIPVCRRRQRSHEHPGYPVRSDQPDGRPDRKGSENARRLVRAAGRAASWVPATYDEEWLMRSKISRVVVAAVVLVVFGPPEAAYAGVAAVRMPSPLPLISGGCSV